MAAGEKIRTNRVSNQGGRVSHDRMRGAVVTGALGKMISKLQEIELAVSTDKGDFDLFGIFLRAGSKKWDLLVAARWAASKKQELLACVAERLQAELDESEMMKISRVVPLSLDDRFLGEIQKVLDVEHGLEQIKGNVFGVDIEDSYIVTSTKAGATLRS